MMTASKAIGLRHSCDWHECRDEVTLSAQLAEVQFGSGSVIRRFDRWLIRARKLVHSVPVLGVKRFDRNSDSSQSSHEFCGKISISVITPEAVAIHLSAPGQQFLVRSPGHGILIIFVDEDFELARGMGLESYFAECLRDAGEDLAAVHRADRAIRHEPVADD